MGFISNTNQMSNAMAERHIREAVHGPSRWTIQVLTAPDATLWVRIVKGKRWTQAPVLGFDPPAWGQFAPFPPPGRRNWTPAIARAIRRAIR